MSFARVKTTGGGKLAYRLKIEGFPYEFVTKASMESAPVGEPERVVGLDISGVKISQRAVIGEAKLEAGGITFRIVDVAGKATLAFSKEPTATTWLTADSSLVGGLTVLDTSAFPSSGVVYVNSEVLSYTSKTSTTFAGTVTRGIWGTLAQTHYAPNADSIRYPEVTDWPTVLQGRRVRLYAYGPGDSPTGAGDQIWLGILRGEPSLRGTTWTLPCDSISALLDQEIGGDISEDVSLRGIFYGSASGRLIIRGRKTGDDFQIEIGDFPSSPAFFETQQDFCDAANTELATAMSGWDTQLSLVPYGEGWAMRVSTGSSLEELEVLIYHAVDGAHDPRFGGGGGAGGEAGGFTIDSLGGVNRNTLYTTTYGPAIGADAVFGTNVFDAGHPISTSSVYYLYPDIGDGKGGVPRGYFVQNEFTALNNNRLYLGGSIPIDPTLNDLCKVQWEDLEEGDDGIYTISDSSSTDRWIEIISSRTSSVHDRIDAHSYRPGHLPKIKLGRNYLSGYGNGTYNLMLCLQLSAPTQLNLGAQPGLRSLDWDSSGWLAAYEGVANYARRRSYPSFGSVPISELLCPDLVLAGLYLTIDTSGRLAVKRLRMATYADAATIALDSTNILTDSTFPSYERAALGFYNTLVIEDGYDAEKDEYVRPKIVVHDVSAFGRSPHGRSIKVPLKSRTDVEPLSIRNAIEVADGILGMLGRPYGFVKLDASFSAFNAVIGTTVTIDSAQLPSSAGVRDDGEVLTGIVVEREVDLEGGRITLGIITRPGRVAGYAFGAKTVSYSNTSGNTWDVTVSSDYFDGSDTAATYVGVGDKIRAHLWDQTGSTSVSGEVDAVTGNVLTITWTSTWTPGSDHWFIRFNDSDTADNTANMRKFAYLADSSGVIDFYSVTLGAFRFEP